MDPRFRQSFAEALAKALRENEERAEHQSQPRSGARSSSEADEDEDNDLVRSTYEQLHFDQPAGLTARGCRLLSRALASADQPQFALSNRLLNGLEQALDRHHHVVERSDGIHLSSAQRESSAATATTAQGAAGATSSPKDAVESNPESTGDSSDAGESLLRPLQAADIEENLAASLAWLAWTVHGRIPLRILCYNAPPDALLGSYREAAPILTHLQESSPVLREPEAAPDNDRQAHNRPRGDDDSPHESVSSGPPPAAAHPLNGSSAHPPLENSNYDDDEVWAAESDASDYDYRESDVGGPSAEEFHAVEPAHWIFTPGPETPRSSSEVAHALVSLLSKLSFRNLAALPWSKTVDEELTQLALALLLPRHHRHGSAILDCLEATAWQQLALRPVHVMRDAATCHPSTRLPAYLQLLHAMIQVHEIQPPSTAAPQSSLRVETTILPPVTWMALSLLSSLCSTTCSDFRNQLKPLAGGREGNVIQQVHACVVEAVDSLVDIFDVISRSPSGVASANDDDHRHDGAKDEILPSLFAPMFRVLALPLPPSSKQVDSFQLLLNSGFFRQLLLFWQDQHEALVRSYTKDGAVARQIVLKSNVECLESALLDLCLASPKLLGKYAWRFPGFAAAVTKADVKTESCCSLEWNLVGMQLSSSVATNVVQWKASSSLSTSQIKPAPSLMECQVAARSLFLRCFQSIEATLAQWKKQRNSDEIASATESVGSQQHFDDHQVLSDFDAMLTRFVLWPLLVDALLSLEDPGDGKGTCWSVRECFVPLQRLLATFPKHQVAAAGDRPKSKLDDTNDLLDQERSPGADGGSGSSDRTSAAPLWKRSAQDAAVDSIRRSLKTLQSLLEASSSSSAVHSHTSPGHRSVAFSSKAD
jgi:hypothetical protein